MKKPVIVALLVLLAFIILGVFVYQSEWYKARSVESFEECLEAGFPVAESYPRQCRAGDKLFVEDISGSTTGGTNGGVNGGGDDDNDDNGTPGPVVTEMIRIDSPRTGAVVSSPLTVRGEARGNWYFEASFPIRLLDGNGKEIAVVPAQAQGEWMTTNFVPFEATLTFAKPTTPTGTLVFERDNPSGLPENAAEVRVPVRFNEQSVTTREVRLYYYNESKDKDASGNVLCSSKGLEYVTRSIPVTNTPIQDTIRALIRGELTAAEKARGISTEFPLSGLSLEAASLSGGVLTLTFDDPQDRTTGGSCRVSVLAAQIEATAKQFSGVNQVRLRPADLFQP